MKKKIIITILLISVVSVVFLFFRESNISSTDKGDGSTDSGTINYNPPTSEESEVGDTVKERLEDNQNSGNSNSEESQSVVPVITYWKQDESSNNILVGGFVPEIIEDGGLCSLILTRGADEVIEERNGVQNAQNTSCGQFEVSRGELTTGSWTAKLKYSSSAHYGESTGVNLEVK